MNSCTLHEDLARKLYDALAKTRAMHNDVGMTQAPDIIGTAEVCEILGIDRSTLSRWIAAEKVVPLQQLPTSKGAYLFIRAYVEALAVERGTKAAS